MNRRYLMDYTAALSPGAVTFITPEGLEGSHNIASLALSFGTQLVDIRACTNGAARAVLLKLQGLSVSSPECTAKRDLMSA